MKTQKIILSAVFALLFVTNVYGTSTGYDYSEDAPKLADKMKFGVGFGMGLMEGSPHNATLHSNTYNFIDLFGEYTINDEIGVRLSLQPTISKEVEIRQVTTMGYLKIAPTLRVYMGADRQFCLLFGPQLGWLASAKIKQQTIDNKGKRKEEVKDLLVEKDREEILGKGIKVNRFARGFKLGWDYECQNGLIVGGVLTGEFATSNSYAQTQSRLESPSDDHGIDLLVLQGQQLFYIGYNFAKLFE
jgi:hypothetical protein